MSAIFICCFFFNDTATTEIYTRPYTLSLHDALPISTRSSAPGPEWAHWGSTRYVERSEEHTSELQSHGLISYAVFCLKKKKEAMKMIMSASHSVTEARALFQRDAEAVARLQHPNFFFFNDTATTEIYTSPYTLSLHDALPISWLRTPRSSRHRWRGWPCEPRPSDGRGESEMSGPCEPRPCDGRGESEVGTRPSEWLLFERGVGVRSRRASDARGEPE